MDHRQPDSSKTKMTPAMGQESKNTNDRFSYSFGFSYIDPKQGYVMEYRGPFKGVGPNLYLRSDRRIRQDILVRLAQNDELNNGRDIVVEVKKGQITLRGVVEDRHARALAEELAFSVPGVIDVHDELRVVPSRAPAARSAQD